MNSFKRFFYFWLWFSLVSCGQTDVGSNHIQIEQILGKPAAYTGKTTVIQGVVNLVNSEKQLFSVISQKEFEECGIAECNASEQLPVRYGGALPRVGEQIEITGVVKKIQQGFVYEAQTIRYLKDI